MKFIAIKNVKGFDVLLNVSNVLYITDNVDCRKIHAIGETVPLCTYTSLTDLLLLINQS